MKIKVSFQILHFIKYAPSKDDSRMDSEQDRDSNSRGILINESPNQEDRLERKCDSEIDSTHSRVLLPYL